jgi:hypothetical protein
MLQHGIIWFSGNKSQIFATGNHGVFSQSNKTLLMKILCVYLFIDLRRSFVKASQKNHAECVVLYKLYFYYYLLLIAAV